MSKFPLENRFCIGIENASEQKFNSSQSFFQPIYIVSHLFGQMPFSIIYHSNGDIHRSTIKKLDAIWFLFSMLAFTCIVFSSIKFYNSKDVSNYVSTISFAGNSFVFGICSILGFLAIILDMCFRFEFIDILKKITTFDGKASSKV